MRLRLKNVVNRSNNFISPPSQGSSSRSGSADGKGRPAKPRYTQADLPFPRERYTDGQGSDCLNRWRSRFIPSLLSWAGAQHDPFGTNCLLAMNNSKEVAKIWDRVYPEWKLHDNDRSIVMTVVCPLALYPGTGSQIPEPEHGDAVTDHVPVPKRYEYLA